jgi:hypothetical protein
MREGFSFGGVHLALKSYMETYDFLRQEGAIESHSHGGSRDQESASEAVEDRSLAPAAAPEQIDENKQAFKLMAGERVVFVEETSPAQYLKLVASGDMDASLLEALEDYVKRQKKRLAGQVQQKGSNEPKQKCLTVNVSAAVEFCRSLPQACRSFDAAGISARIFLESGFESTVGAQMDPVGASKRAACASALRQDHVVLTSIPRKCLPPDDSSAARGKCTVSVVSPPGSCLSNRLCGFGRG